jgi:hypothetical protein
MVENYNLGVRETISHSVIPKSEAMRNPSAHNQFKRDSSLGMTALEDVPYLFRRNQGAVPNFRAGDLILNC